jgi:F-type H+-transporting ATPase subunit b
MLSIMLATVTTAVSGGEESLPQRFGIEPTFLLMQVISFSILAWVLYKFMIKPIIGTVDERNQKIESGLKYADEMKAKLDATQQESAAIIKKAQLEAAKFIEEARKAAKDFSDREQKAAGERANDVVAKAQQAIELEHKKMLADARSEIARLVVATTQRVLAKELNDADRTRYNESATRELTSV